MGCVLRPPRGKGKASRDSLSPELAVAANRVVELHAGHAGVDPRLDHLEARPQDVALRVDELDVGRAAELEELAAHAVALFRRDEAAVGGLRGYGGLLGRDD